MPSWWSYFSETLRQNTLYVGYHGGSAQLLPRPEDLGHCSVLTHDCLPHCKENKKPDVIKHFKLNVFQIE